MSDGKKTKRPETENSSRSPSSLVRLPSFRQPRDLTLGGGNSSRGGLAGNKNRKTFAPNLNVQRNKNKDEVKVKEEPGRSKSQERGRGKGQRGKNERGRGRGNVIQMSNGVFSEGIAAASKFTRTRENNDTSSNYVPKPKLDLKQNFLADAKEEGDRLKELLQDNFIDDPDVGGGCGIKPLQLPMLPLKKRSGTAVVKKEKLDPDVKPDPDAPEGELKVKIKNEPLEEEELMGGENKQSVDAEGLSLHERGVQQLFGSREPEYILVQLPDCLPGLRPSVEPENSKGSIPPSGSSAGAGATAENTAKPQCTLGNLPEGLIGKIQVLRSGRAHLQLGGVCLPISMGTQVSFKQDLISVKLNESEKAGSMINLGQVRARMVLTPDWETMLTRT